MNINQLLFLASLVVGLAVGFRTNTADVEWKLWKLRYNKVYQTVEEETMRKEIWLKHYAVFTDHRANPMRQFEMDINEFSDQILPRSKLEVTIPDVEVGIRGQFRFTPDSWDWRDHRAVTPVITQGNIDDVVSIVATESVESYTKIKGGKLKVMSFMETKQCCVPEPILSLDVFTCLHKIGGLCSARKYPSTATSCRNDSCRSVGDIKGAKQSASGDEEALREIVATMPVMAGVDAQFVSFHMYTSGIYSEPGCRTTSLNHVVQIVGYGSQDGQDYWICKNSWANLGFPAICGRTEWLYPLFSNTRLADKYISGECGEEFVPLRHISTMLYPTHIFFSSACSGKHWGMDGYIWIARNKNNMCGIATAAFYPM